MSAQVLQVTAGVGPIEARRFVALLAERLAAACADRGAVVSDIVAHGDETAPSSVEIHLAAAPPDVAELAGTHALIARSAERGKRARKRWYVGVRLCAAPERAATVQIDRADVEITAMRAGGPGGQNVNKTSSAVRVHHRASGITVRVADERSQRENVRVALERLSALLARRAQDSRAGAKADLRLQHYRLERGRPAHLYRIDKDGGLSVCEPTCSK